MFRLNVVSVTDASPIAQYLSDLVNNFVFRNSGYPSGYEGDRIYNWKDWTFFTLVIGAFAFAAVFILSMLGVMAWLSWSTIAAFL